jgi:hypothetical protein
MPMPDPKPTAAMIEAKAIILFYEDELENLRWIAESDAAGKTKVGDKIGRDLDCWERHPDHVQERFRNRARQAFGIEFPEVKEAPFG